MFDLADEVNHCEVMRYRSLLKDAKRLVIKVGTSLLVNPGGSLQRRRMRQIAHQLASLQRAGKEIILVSSGAVSAGREALGMQGRPKTLPELQMAASVGQTRLMSEYGNYFTEEGIIIGQVLVTRDDLKHRRRHLNMRNTMLGLLRHGFIPIVNENDVVSVDELKFGDNDVLASLVSAMIGADLLILMTSTNGLYRECEDGSRDRLPFVAKVDQHVLDLAKGKGSEHSTGGMATKLQAANTVLRVGATAVIADGRDPKNIGRIVEGKDVGTLFGVPSHISQPGMQGRKRWIAFFHHSHGSVLVDDGAVRAVEEKGHSLLPVGVMTVEGVFKEGDLVDVRDSHGELIARGLVEFESDDLRKIQGRKSKEIVGILGRSDYEEVIHRDNMVLMRKDRGREHSGD